MSAGDIFADTDVIHPLRVRFHFPVFTSIEAGRTQGFCVGGCARPPH